jgi:proton glutamate symport protein
MSWHRKSHWQILVALGLAVATGVVLRAFFPQLATGGMVVETCRVLGELFMRGLKMIIVPIVFTSIVCGIGGVGAMKGFGRLGLKTVLFYGFTTFLAATLGLLMVNAIQPGLQDGQPNPVVNPEWVRLCAIWWSAWCQRMWWNRRRPPTCSG